MVPRAPHGLQVPDVGSDDGCSSEGWHRQGPEKRIARALRRGAGPLPRSQPPGWLFRRPRTAGPGGPARTRGSAPQLNWILPPTKSVPSLTSLTFWLLAGKTASFILTLALPLLLVRRLSQEEFGLYKQAFLVVNTAIGILPLSFQMSAYYFLPRETDRKGSVMLNILLFHAFTTGFGCLALFLFPALLQVI